jgi:DNA topoisomerase IA
MQMKLVLAEKPSVAQSIAKVLGAAKREDGYLEGNGYVVSWCVGHLVELAQPEVYDAKYSKWAYADLPIFPMDWQYEVSAGTKKQFGILKKLMAREDVASLVCATDAGREGELIFRLVYHKAGCRKPFERLWISSMEDVAIKEGFENLRSGTEYDALYEAALCRERADWIATSSIEEIQSRSNGFLHPALWYTNRKISSPSRPASVAHTRLATSSLAMSFFRIPNCFFVPAETSYCQSIGKIGRSA